MLCNTLLPTLTIHYRVSWQRVFIEYCNLQYVCFISENPSAYIRRFNNDAIGAFSYVLDKLTNLLSSEFGNLKPKFESICKEFPQDFTSKMIAAKSSNELVKVLNLQEYCNWFNIRILKRIVNFAENPTATKWMDAYEKYLYQKKISDVLPCFKSTHFYNPDHFTSVYVYINKNFDSLIVKDIIKYCEFLESEIKIPAGGLYATDVTSNCLIISCASPVYCLQHMYEMAKKVRFKFRKYHIQYIQIGFFPKAFTTHIPVNKEFLSDITFTMLNCKFYNQVRYTYIIHAFVLYR